MDLACGQRKTEGFYGVDIADVEGVDLVYDLAEFPWPWEDGSVEEIFVSHYVEHTFPVGGHHDGLIAFMNECYRILETGGKLRIVHPFLKTTRAFQDPTHTRFIPDATWFYFNRAWREEQKLDHYPITADFEVANVGGAVNEFNPLQPQNRSLEAQTQMATLQWDVMTDLVIDLVALEG